MNDIMDEKSMLNIRYFLLIAESYFEWLSAFGLINARETKA